MNPQSQMRTNLQSVRLPITGYSPLKIKNNYYFLINQFFDPFVGTRRFYSRHFPHFCFLSVLPYWDLKSTLVFIIGPNGRARSYDLMLPKHPLSQLSYVWLFFAMGGGLEPPMVFLPPGSKPGDFANSSTPQYFY